MKIETQQDLENIVNQQNTLIEGLGALVKKMDECLKLQQEIIVKFQGMFDAHGWAPVMTITSKRSEQHFDA